MRLKDYFDLTVVLAHDTATKEKKRAFGLEHQAIRKTPLSVLKRWLEIYRKTLVSPRLSEKLCGYLRGMTLTLGIVSLFLGIFSGMALLNYSGREPVNVVYFMAVAIVLPLVTMAVSLAAMLRAGAPHTFLVHISPAYWMEKLIALLPGKTGKYLEMLSADPSLTNWLIIRRAQLLALLFSIGLLMALLGVVATKDIAFAWSTTLHITPEAFHRMLETVAVPWSSLFPSAIPSLTLIEQSRYFRLGTQLDPKMVSDAFMLGEWWKFLALSTFFYAVVLRVVMLGISIIGYNRALKRAVLALEGVASLLQAMYEPLIATASPESEKNFQKEGNHYSRETEMLDAAYDAALGWAMGEESIILLNDIMQCKSTITESVGGLHSLEEDESVARMCKGEVVLYVKAWEPPTMDFVDFLEILVSVSEKVTVVPVGTSEEDYLPKERGVAVWGRKLEEADMASVWLKV